MERAAAGLCGGSQETGVGSLLPLDGILEAFARAPVPTERREMSGVGSSRLFVALSQTEPRVHLFPTELYKASFLRLVYQVTTVISRAIGSATMRYTPRDRSGEGSGIAPMVFQRTITRVNGNLEWLLIGARTRRVQFAKEHAHQQIVPWHEHETWKVDWEREANEITADIPILP